jgi:hypothetical protein
MGKRDRWDSSSDEEEELSKRPAVASTSASTASLKNKPESSLKPAAEDKEETTVAQLPRHNPLLSGCRSVYVSNNVEKNVLCYRLLKTPLQTQLISLPCQHSQLFLFMH